jgi:hypothetical protein
MASVHGEVDVAVEENVKRRRTTMAEGDADDEEEDVCRICRMTGEDDSPLYYPCACSGSIKYVHQECLVQWLNHSKARQCEVWIFFLCFPDALCPYGVTMLVLVFRTCRDASTESDFVLNFKATRSFESGLSCFSPRCGRFDLSMAPGS